MNTIENNPPSDSNKRTGQHAGLTPEQVRTMLETMLRRKSPEADPETPQNPQALVIL